MNLWIVGKIIDELESGQVWDFHGVFSSEQLAVDRCRDDSYFVGPIILDLGVPEVQCEWPGSYFPKAVEA